MNIILTGITGNIGYEVAQLLIQQGHTVIPIVRPQDGETAIERVKRLHPDFAQIEECISVDLQKDVPFYSGKAIDCIVHCAGIVHFKKAGTSNRDMVKRLVEFAKRDNLPLYHVSTAYLYKPQNEVFHNEYEIDKAETEALLASSSLPHIIFRPSIVTGHSETGELLHFSGYYLLAKAFVHILKTNDYVRFPSSKSDINIIPVDWVARAIVDSLENVQEQICYITDPNPLSFDELLKRTLAFYGLDHKIDLVPMSFDEYKELDLSLAERELLRMFDSFIPYVTGTIEFPSSLCTSSIPPDYIDTILGYAEKHSHEKME